MPFHEHISTKFESDNRLWQLTENEQTIATLLSEKERRLIDSQNLSQTILRTGCIPIVAKQNKRNSKRRYNLHLRG